MPQRTAAGAICRCCTLQGCHGMVPALKGLAKIQSSGLLNSIMRCQFNSTSASAGSSGIPAREYSVLTSLTTVSTNIPSVSRRDLKLESFNCSLASISGFVNLRKLSATALRTEDGFIRQSWLNLLQLTELYGM